MKTISCAWRTIRPNKHKLQNLEQRNFYHGAKQEARWFMYLSPKPQTPPRISQVRKAGCKVCDQFLHNSLIGWWWSNRVVSQELILSILRVWFLGQEDPLEEEGMATHYSVLAWRIPWAEKPGGLQSIELQESDRTEATNTHSRRSGVCVLRVTK